MNIHQGFCVCYVSVVFDTDGLMNMCYEFVTRVVKECPVVDGVSIIPICKGESDEGVDQFLSPRFPSDVRGRLIGPVVGLIIS